MKPSIRISSTVSSLDVIASGNRDRIRGNARSRHVKFHECDPIHIVMARLADSFVEELEDIANTLERIEE